MITHLSIKNFKSWERTGPIRLAPLTVFFGTNSSGKSSIGQLLLTLKQTVDSADRTRVLDPGNRSTPVDIGRYTDFIFNHDVDRDLEFEVGWTQSKALEIRDVLDPSVQYSDHHITFRAVIFGDGRRPDLMRVRSLEYKLGADPAKAAFSARLERVPPRNSYELSFDGFSPIRRRGRPKLASPTRFYGFPDESVASFRNTAFLPDLSLSLEQMLDSLSYLGPLRTPPERVYLWAGGTPEDVGWSGEDTVDALLAAQDRGFNLEFGKRLRPLQEMVAACLRDLGLISSFHVRATAPGRAEQEVLVKVTPKSREVLLTDVGMGISQVLPVIVQSFYVAPSSTIVMEQPELHLHPAVQQNLADFFIQAGRAREDSAPRETQFLIESHSEHFLRRLQRRIAEERLKPQDVALYFCEIVNGRSRLSQLQIDLFGNIANWPVNFFGDPVTDIASQTEASLERALADK